MPAVGIDISDYAIKYAMFKNEHAELPLKAYGKIDLPLDIIEQGEIRDPGTIIKHLSRLREEHGFRYAHLSLPEEHAYLFQLDLQKARAGELEQMLEFQLKENVPLGADEAVFDYNVLRKTAQGLTLNVSVYPSAIAEQYVRAVEEAGISVLSMEIEGQSTARALLDDLSVGATLVVDIGRNDANLSITSKGIVTFTASLEIGGDDLTKAIARSLDISFQKAEQLKRLHGFSDTEESGIVYQALLKEVKSLADAIRRHLMYWQMHMKNASGKKETVSRVILSGGSANMSGLCEYLTAMLGVPVEVGSVWTNVSMIDEVVPEIPLQESQEYAAALGLALRTCNRKS
jgi:type IV pilus assembly protein PilM